MLGASAVQHMCTCVYVCVCVCVCALTREHALHVCVYAHVCVYEHVCVGFAYFPEEPLRDRARKTGASSIALR